MANIDPKIFKSYDIRGIYPDEIDEEAAYRIGRAVVRFLDAKDIIVGKDIRSSSDSLYDSLKNGITDEGANVIYLGKVTTPMLYYASGKIPCDGGIMITASHNPAQYNGFKLCRPLAVPIGEDSGMDEIKKLSLESEFYDSEKKGMVESHEIINVYLDYIASFADFKDKKMKIVIDPANSMSILEIPIYQKFSNNIEMVSIFDNFDNTFPNHEANPIKPETLSALQQKIVETGSDLGIAYDGDGDRVGFIDEQGGIIPMDLVTALIAKMILKKKPDSTMLYDLRSSMSVKEIIEENGGLAIECRVGHALIKKQMRETSAVFAGELSGHYYFDENYKAECGSLPAIYLLNLIAETGQPISELVAETKRYFHSGEINSEVKDKDAVMQKLKVIYKDGILSELDGVKISFWNNEPGKRWWFNVRPSNTEPLLRLNLEADNEQLMEEKKEELLKVILE
jgi:phosphomannomutase